MIWESIESADLSYRIKLSVLCGLTEFISLTPTQTQTEPNYQASADNKSASGITRQTRGREFEYISAEAKESSIFCLLIKSCRLPSGPSTSQQRNKSLKPHANHQKTRGNEEKTSHAEKSCSGSGGLVSQRRLQLRNAINSDDLRLKKLQQNNF